MTETTDHHPAPPANENRNPFLRADTALDELYRLRTEVLGRNTKRLSFDQWRQRKEALEELDAAISLCLGKL